MPVVTPSIIARRQLRAQEPPVCSSLKERPLTPLLAHHSPSKPTAMILTLAPLTDGNALQMINPLSLGPFMTVLLFLPAWQRQESSPSCPAQARLLASTIDHTSLKYLARWLHSSRAAS